MTPLFTPEVKELVVGWRFAFGRCASLSSKCDVRDLIGWGIVSFRSILGLLSSRIGIVELRS